MTIIADQGGKTPFLSEEARDFLRRRGEEIIGVALAFVAVLMGLALGSYNAADPSYFNATPAAPANALGLAGAWFSDALIRTLGLAAWGLPAALTVWAWRFMTHQGAKSGVLRIAFTPLAILLTTIAASAHRPYSGWAFDNGLGGIIGDALLGQLVRVTPLSATLALIVLALTFTLAAFIAWCCALGVSRGRLLGALRWMAAGSGSTLRWAGGQVARRGGRALGAAVEAMRARRSKTRSEKLEPPKPIGGFRRVEPNFGDVDEDEDFVERVVASPLNEADADDAERRPSCTAPQTPPEKVAAPRMTNSRVWRWKRMRAPVTRPQRFPISRTRRGSRARRFPTPRLRKTPACWKACWTTMASAVQSNRSNPVRWLRCISWSPRPA